MSASTPFFHPGELALQSREGVVERNQRFAERALRDFMPDQHREFFAQLPFMVVGSVDDVGHPWASLLTGEPGFAHSPEPTRLVLDVSHQHHDPVWRGLHTGDAVGLLGIELETRRRNRVNGLVRRTPSGLAVTVVHSYGNCPKYIHQRAVERVAVVAAPKPTWSDGLTPEAREWIAAADTFYVCSYVDLPGGRQIDVSHRGGKPGFVRVGPDDVLTIPDFSGNRLFNTLGNMVSNPRAGLVFVDFDSGDLLQITGSTNVIVEGPEVVSFEGAERLWTLTPTHVVRRKGALDLRARLLAPSANTERTGSW